MPQLSFTDIATEHGGYLERGVLPDHQRSRLELLADLPSNLFPDHNRIQSQLSTCFFNQKRLNACAAGDGSKYMLGINGITVPLIHSVFNQIFSMRDVLDEFGPSNDEHRNVQQLILQFNEAVTFDEIEFGANRCFVPKSKTRREISVLCGRIATNFILFHEFGHVIGGHIDYMGSHYGVRYIAEFFTKLWHVPFQRISHVIEYDADRWAACFLSHLLKSEKIYPFLSIDGKHLEFRDICRILALTTGILFRVLGYLGGDPRVASKTHPSPDIRQAAVHWWLCRFGTNKQRRVVMEDSCEEVMNSLQVVCQKLGLLGMEVYPFRFELMHRYLESLESRRSDLESEFKSLAPFVGG